MLEAFKQKELDKFCIFKDKKYLKPEYMQNNFFGPSSEKLKIEIWSGDRLEVCLTQEKWKWNWKWKFHQMKVPQKPTQLLASSHCVGLLWPSACGQF